MHTSSMNNMGKMVEMYELRNCGVVVELGSYNYNGTYRQLFDGSNVMYIGADIREGPGVDVVVGSDAWNNLRYVDAIIAGQTLENVEDIPALMNKCKDMLKEGGIACFISPSAGPPHHYPVWNGLFTIESMTKIMEDAGFNVVSCVIDTVPIFNDCCCVVKKPQVKVKSPMNEETKDQNQTLKPNPNPRRKFATKDEMNAEN